jgi:hypothetical protein
MNSSDVVTGDLKVNSTSIPTIDTSLPQETVPSSCSAQLAEEVVAGIRNSDVDDLYPVLRQIHGEEAVSRWVDEYNPLSCGLQVLAKYIKVARGPLKSAGWDYTRAVQLTLDMRRVCVSVGK